MRLRRLATTELTDSEVTAIRALMDVAFGPDEDERFTDDDWAHAIGGVHFVLDDEGDIVTHASVVERELHIDGVPLRTGYVEAVATAPDRENQGHGSTVMEAVGEHIREIVRARCARHRPAPLLRAPGLGDLDSGRRSCGRPDGPVRTPDEEGYILVLRTPSSPPFELDADAQLRVAPRRRVVVRSLLSYGHRAHSGAVSR